MEAKRKVKDLGANEAVHCPTPELDLAFRKLMHEAGLTKVLNSSWLESKDFEVYEDKTVYYPKNKAYGSIKRAKSEGHTIHPASDFLPQEQQYTITREQLGEIHAVSNEASKVYINHAIIYKNAFSSIISLNDAEVFGLYQVINSFDDNTQAKEILEKHLPKPKQKVEVDVWVNVYENIQCVHFKLSDAELGSGKSALHSCIPGKLTYEI